MIAYAVVNLMAALSLALFRFQQRDL